MAEVLGKQPRPQGPRLVIVTNAGGPGVLATDALIGEGGELAELSEDTIAQLDAFLPPHWSHANPIDILGDADSRAFRARRSTSPLKIPTRRPAGHPRAAGNDQPAQSRREN